MKNLQPWSEHAFEWIRLFSVGIGARGSCTAQMRRASEAAVGELRRLGVQQVHTEAFQGAPSTYRPFVLAFASAVVGSLLALFVAERWALALGALLSGLGAWAMLAETDFRDHWARHLLPRAPTQNVVGVVPPTAELRQRAVLCAHLDTHRTPVFYSSPGWLNAFSILVGGTFASMGLGALLLLLGAATDGLWLRWAVLPLAALQTFALALMVSADFTPYTPGANDNTSGVAVALALAERLQTEPLAHTEVQVLLTDCEETGASGSIAYLDAHAAELNPQQALYIAIDQVGAGIVKYLTADGLILKHATHPRALELARRAHQALPQVKTLEMAGPAYTDALPATKRGVAALTLCCVDEVDPAAGLNWHQMSDTLEHVQREALEDMLCFTWQILLEMDKEAVG